MDGTDDYGPIDLDADLGAAYFMHDGRRAALCRVISYSPDMEDAAVLFVTTNTLDYPDFERFEPGHPIQVALKYLEFIRI